MAYIDQTYVQNALTAEVQTAIAPVGAVLTQFLADASGMVDAALEGAGYPTPLTGTIPDIIKVATLGAFLPLAYGREGLPVPEQFLIHTNVFEAIRRGDIQVPGIEPDKTKGPGASKFTDSTSSATTAKPPVFKDLRKLY